MVGWGFPFFMKLINKPLLEKCLSFFRNLKKEDKIAVLHHTDCDGISSGVIVWKLIQKLVRTPDFRFNQEGKDIEILPSTVELLKKRGINKVVCSDLSCDYNPEQIREVSKFAEICIIDHHKVYNELNEENIILIKPHMIYENVDGSQYCAAKFCYDLGSMLTNMEDADWVAAIGVIGDMNKRSWEPFLKGVFKKYNIKEEQNIFESDLGKITILVSSAEAVSSLKNTAESFKVLESAKSLKDVLSSDLRRFQKEVQTELEYWLNNADRNAEFHEKENLIIYEVHPKFNLTGQISTLFSIKHPNTTVIIANTKEDPIKISARRQDQKVAMNTMLETIFRNMKSGKGGGHIPAAGGAVPKKDYKKFKEMVLEYLKP